MFFLSQSGQPRRNKIERIHYCRSFHKVCLYSMPILFVYI
jgi:hypothetical protein